MTVTQGFMLSQELQPAATTGLWTYETQGTCGVFMPTGATNFSSIFPGTQNFCWESWIFTKGRSGSTAMITAWQTGGNAGGPQNSNFSLYFDTNTFGAGLMTVRAKVFAQQTIGIREVNPALIFNNQWHHVAMSRSGTTLSVWFDGELYGLLEDFTGDLSQANIASDGYVVAGGPVGDRDEDYGFGTAGRFRNTRWTTGNRVYPPGLTISPPPIVPPLQAVTGTQWVWWPGNETNAFYDALSGLANPWIPDINANSYQFTNIAGSSSGPSVTPTGVVAPTNQVTTPLMYDGFDIDVVGTWTNSGPPGNEPRITTTGPTPVIGTAIADFTGAGTDVRITSTDSPLKNWSDSFFFTAWFYMPANITNECKNLIYCDGVTNGFVLNIGRPGQGLDWLSIYLADDTEVAYGQHIWARNSWNYLTVQQDRGTGSVNGPVSAWAGTINDTYAKNLNMTMVSTTLYGSPTSVSIGCKPGSAVSCQLYLNLIQLTTGIGNFAQSTVYSPTEPAIPIQTWQYRKLVPGETFTFQGTNGSTDIQPIGL